MALDVKHLKISAVADGVNTDKVQPSDWNDSHQLTGFGGAAELNVGTVAGTVAAGDHVHSADQITVVPSGSLISTDVQAALEELNSDLDAAVMTTSIGKHTIYLPAGTLKSATTDGATAGSIETTTNKVNYTTFDFPDGAAKKYVHFNIGMPKGWNLGTFIFKFRWTANSTSTNPVVWGVQGAAISDGDDLDVAWGTAQTVAQANKSTAYKKSTTSATAALTVAGTPASEDMVVFRVFRDPTDGSDTLAATASLLGVTVTYTTSAATDD